MSDGTPFALAGKHALVAGVGGPLARPVAVALAEGGATVSLMTQADDRPQEVEAQSILNECWSLGHDGQVVRLDSTDEEAVARAIDGLETQLGPIGVLVTVAPAIHRQPAAALKRAGWEAELAAAATSTVIPALTLGRRMLDRGSGRVLCLVSDAYAGDEAETAAFAAAQGAVLAFAHALAAEWSPRGVLVGVLVADAVETAVGPHAHADLRRTVRELLTSGSPSRGVEVGG